MTLLDRIYSLLLNRLPPSSYEAVSKVVELLLKKPFCADNIPKIENEHFKILPYPGGFKAALCISADFEMSWAWRYAKKTPSYDKGTAERKNFTKILSYCGNYNIPVTWAIVGHLFLESCEKINGGKHPEMMRPQYFKNRNWSFHSGDWYEHDPCSNVQSFPNWYAPDLIQKIIDSRVKHEIACHTFSHIDFSYENCPRELANNEVKRCIEVMGNFGLRPSAFIFPGGTKGNYEVLIKHGIIVTRYRKDKIELSYPFKNDHGLWIINTSCSLEGDENWGPDYTIRRLKRYIDRAIEKQLVCHLWFHPSVNTNTIERVFPEIFQYASKKREEGLLWIDTMSPIASFCEIRDKTVFSFRESRNKLDIDIEYNYDKSRYRAASIAVKLKDSKIRMNSDIRLRIDGKETKQKILTPPLLNIPINTQSIAITY